MSNDIRQMLERLATVEGRLTPTGVNHGLNSQQREVPQLPALFKPKHIRALGSRTDPAHPMDGYMVGDSTAPRGNALEEAIAEIEEDMVSKVKKDLTQYLDHLEKKGHVSNELKNKARDAIERGEVEEDEVEEGDDSPLPQTPGEFAAGAASGALGYKLLSNPIVQRAMPVAGAVYQGADAFNRANLGDKVGSAISLAGAGLSVDPITSPLAWGAMGVQAARDKYKTGEFFPSDEKIKSTYYRSVLEPPIPPANQRPTGPRPPSSFEHPMKENAPVKTYTMEDGTCLECHGDDQSGYEIRNGEQVLPTRFSNLDHADMAVKIFQKRREANQNQDYLEEK
jgi:hypothetical protein